MKYINGIPLKRNKLKSVVSQDDNKQHYLFCASMSTYFYKLLSI